MVSRRVRIWNQTVYLLNPCPSSQTSQNNTDASLDKGIWKLEHHIPKCYLHINPSKYSMIKDSMVKYIWHLTDSMSHMPFDSLKAHYHIDALRSPEINKKYLMCLSLHFSNFNRGPESYLITFWKLATISRNIYWTISMYKRFGKIFWSEVRMSHITLHRQGLCKL